MPNPQFCNHAVTLKNPNDYMELIVSPAKVLEAWQTSIFAHELIAKDGRIKNEQDLSGTNLEKYLTAFEALKRGESIEKPLLGIGLYDGIEIGIGREIIAAAYHLKLENLPVHVRKAQSDDVRRCFSC
jgi:hypothetical protein